MKIFGRTINNDDLFGALEDAYSGALSGVGRDFAEGFERGRALRAKRLERKNLKPKTGPALNADFEHPGQLGGSLAERMKRLLYKYDDSETERALRLREERAHQQILL
jgi:hypothetical protein